ncbi:3071_t:CDS:2, partial [Funneliformis geosporum]
MISKRIEEATKQQSKVFGVIPYMYLKRFGRRQRSDRLLNEKSDVYSVGVLLWEMSSGRPPFYVEGLREIIIPGTPEDYVTIYTECWDMNEIVDKLNAIITKSN